MNYGQLCLKAASSYGGFVFSLEHQGLWLERTLAMCRACNPKNFKVIEADIGNKDFGKGSRFTIQEKFLRKNMIWYL